MRDAPQLANSGSPRRASRPLLALLERLLWLFSLACLGAVLWMKADAWWYQSQASAHWQEARRERAASLETRRETEAPVSETPPPFSSSSPDQDLSRLPAVGTPIGRLSIPRLDLVVMVAEGTTDEILQRAVGHVTGSSTPGEGGNVVLAGHRDTFFRPLEAIRIGDRIELDDGLRTYGYRVESTEVVAPEQTEVPAPSPDERLTLITCYPFRYIGPAPERFIVRARPVEEEVRSEAKASDLRAGG